MTELVSAGDRALSVHSAPDQSAEQLLQILAAMLRELRPAAPARPVHLDDRIERDLGLDSLSRVELVSRVERAFGIRLPESLATAARTPRDLLDAIAHAERVTSNVVPPPLPAPPPEPVIGHPEAAATLVEAFRWHLERHPDREHITLIEGDKTAQTMSYAGLWAEAGEVATGLTEQGVGRGDAVALMLPTSAAFFQVFLGAMRIGAIPVPMYPPLRWSEIEEHVRGREAILANSLARVLVTVPEAMFIGQIVRATLPDLRSVINVDRLRAAAATIDVAAVASHDTAMLQYTSGSTGDPKGVILSHAALLANIRAMGRAAAVTSTDRFVSWLPLYHDMGLIGAWLTTMYHAVPLVLMSPTSFLGRPSRWLWAIHRYRGTISGGPNFAYEIAASKVRDEDLIGLDLGSWRLAFNGAEPVRAATLERFAARFAAYGFDRRSLTPVYGLAESALGVAFPPLGRGPLVERIDSARLAHDGTAIPSNRATSVTLEVVSCGRPLPGHEMRVVDEDGRETPERTEGRIEFRGPSATSGYYRNPDATAKLFHDDWLDTGDVGYVAGGELFLTSRAKDLIKRGGHALHPYDLEAAVGEVPGIRKGCVAVFGTADRASGTERVIVVAETNQSALSARAALRERIMALATVHLNGPADEVLLVPARTILKTSSGKIRRAACQALYDNGLLEAPRRAVWLQLALLIGNAIAARLRHGAHSLARFAYGGYSWLVFLSLSGLSVAVLALPLPPRARFLLAHAIAKTMLRALGLPLSIEGLERMPSSRPVVIVVNHASYLDAIVVLAALASRVHFVAKREFARTPLFGFVLRRLGTYFVERVDPARGIEDTHELVAAVSRGETVVLFPEGTFSRAPGLAAFRLGAFAVSAETGVPVVPVLLRGTRSVLREHRWLPSRVPITVDVQFPIMPSGRDWSAAVQLRDQVRVVMLRGCGEPDLTT
jgi:acyl carrier protein